MFRSDNFLRFVLRLDCATCVATGLLLTLGSGLIAELTLIPASLSLFAGLSLFPIALFIGIVSMLDVVVPTLVWLVIAGNALWAGASILLILDGGVVPNAIGYVFILVQAAAVAFLAELEFFGLRRLPRASVEANVSVP
jgi:hypothetical protein